MEVRLIKDAKGYYHAELVSYERNGGLERVRELSPHKDRRRAVNAAIEEVGKRIDLLLDLGKPIVISSPNDAPSASEGESESGEGEEE